jgi:hypothetical protein
VKPKVFNGMLVFTMLCLRGVLIPGAFAQAILFDFDNAPLHSSLPISQTVNGITAFFKATGQGYSIQDANVLGFTPQGFSGRIIYPNSIYQADLLIRFDSTLIDFSIMYSCQELGCDDAATMRVTAFMKGILVGTSTKTASNPGNWPVDVLRCSFAQGFDSVVVHYDKRPPTCQDYGVIFMADNMRVTAYNPATIQFCPPVSGTIIDAGVTGNSYQWQSATGTVFSNISDNANYSGTTSYSLTLINIPSSWAGIKLRCLADGYPGNVFTLKFSETWIGFMDTTWENPANWDCNQVPDEFTDVLMDAGATHFPTVNSNAYCRSLSVPPGTVVNIKPGFVLYITGKK